MNCVECREILSAALDAEASPAELQTAEAHLAGCADCRAFRDDLAADRALLQQWPDELPGVAAGHRSGRFRHLAAAAVLILAIGAGFVAGRVSATGEDGPTISGPVERSGPDALVLRESTRYYPDTNEMHSTIVLRSDGRTKG
jgi:predicted anti-sigma-YlaC factor YlaD